MGNKYLIDSNSQSAYQENETLNAINLHLLLRDAIPRFHTKALVTLSLSIALEATVQTYEKICNFNSLMSLIMYMDNQVLLMCLDLLNADMQNRIRIRYFQR